VHIARTEQSMRGWIVRGSPRVLPCSTGWQPLCVIPLPATQWFDHCPLLPTDMLERVLFCLGHCLAGHQKDCFSLGNGTTRAVNSVVCRGRVNQPQLPEKYDPCQWWKTSLMIALLRVENSVWKREQGPERQLRARIQCPWQRPQPGAPPFFAVRKTHHCTFIWTFWNSGLGSELVTLRSRPLRKYSSRSQGWKKGSHSHNSTTTILQSKFAGQVVLFFFFDLRVFNKD